MKIVATSDFHGHLPDIPECDLLLIAGDVCPVENHERQYQSIWLKGDFYDWMRQQPAKVTVWCGGNHDFVLQDWRRKPEQIKKLPGVYLDNSWCEYYPGMKDGANADWPENKPLKIYATPMSNRFGGWAFMDEEDKLSELYKTIPRDIDILITHGPPFGRGDFVPSRSYSAVKRGWVEGVTGEHVGSSSLLHQLSFEEWPNLKLVICGHIHEAYGKYNIGDIDIYNVAHMDGAYEPNNPPVVIELNA